MLFLLTTTSFLYSLRPGHKNRHTKVFLLTASFLAGINRPLRAILGFLLFFTPFIRFPSEADKFFIAACVLSLVMFAARSVGYCISVGSPNVQGRRQPGRCYPKKKKKKKSYRQFCKWRTSPHGQGGGGGERFRLKPHIEVRFKWMWFPM